MNRFSIALGATLSSLSVAPACGQSSEPPPDPQPQAQSNVQAQAAAVRVYEVPAGSRPHDVAPAPDGRIWYTGQRRGTLGVLEGPDGAAWITDSGLNAIVRVDPRTDQVRVWPLPAEFPDSNLNTAAFDREGRIWFTGQ